MGFGIIKVQSNYMTRPDPSEKNILSSSSINGLRLNTANKTQNPRHTLSLSLSILKASSSSISIERNFVLRFEIMAAVVDIDVLTAQLGINWSDVNLDSIQLPPGNDFGIER